MMCVTTPFIYVILHEQNHSENQPVNITDELFTVILL